MVVQTVEMLSQKIIETAMIYLVCQLLLPAFYEVEEGA
ncbi:hypothetical protein Metho_2634 (plasmid) [Methanomethylovorans hollandica DSM 15978]|uniref:Uncharacterized protein n=1 Tax=Methanomethylovorans hollandica (strain DSM 15978 / NBRC 107637 / DMS1) TaxID=867904 RepID=L0L088_METHD|nr:hypothetical protein Metho_2634 [Methanomethylovorans hollandica DSM 15978]